MMRKCLSICLLILLVFIFSVGNNSTKKNTSYQVDNTPGEIIYISLEEVQNKINQKDTFAITFSTTTCLYCKNYHDIFDQYIKKHHVVMYEVVLDNEPLSAKENRQIIQTNFPEFDTTPGVFYVEKGKKISYLDFKKEGLNKKTISKWIKKYQMDKK